MTKREKIIYSLDCCSWGIMCSYCPYKDEPECKTILMCDTLALLKEQEARLQELETPTNTKYYPATIKDKINVQATLTSVRGFDSMYGYTYIYTFTLDEYVFVWMTTKDLGLEVGTTVDLCGTIKGFEEYNGTLQTQVTRCKVSVATAA